MPSKLPGTDQQFAGFIREDEIHDTLAAGKQASNEAVRRIIAKGRAAGGLSLAETAALLQNGDPVIQQELFDAAREVKLKIYGKRLVLFAPLYVSDYCLNNCLYCGYRRDNIFRRSRLTQEELAEEVRVLESLGHKRLALEAGEHPDACPLDYILDCINTIYSLKFKNGSIRRINVNIAATTVEEYARLKAARIGTYILFQETYHRDTYRRMHPEGPKSDYDWHTTAHHRAMQAGIDDVGFGVLLGLYDYKFELLAMLMHARELEETFGVGPHTISVPRLRPAFGVTLDQFPHLVPDEDFARIVAILRLAVPYTGLILSTRERAAFRDQLLDLGVSQTSAGSCTGVGGYRRENSKAEPEETLDTAPQFSVDDHRSPDQVLQSICQAGYLPSYCTACYRQGRTGDRFMELAKSGKIQDVCQPNAILTFKEYLLDYGSPQTKQAGEEAIGLHLAEIKNGKLRAETAEKLQRIEQGERDLYM
ncbi:MAG TPA: [FeFe] hydrogenase H-cluster radical SAM maturase HydG [Firmicutes bacterium]|nr:[FeFe] hydrogenase H-cluster radical SAM maturase HydG [Bacillota bacterium]